MCKPCPRQGPPETGAPGRIRTPDTWVRSPVLYPAELRARGLEGGDSSDLVRLFHLLRTFLVFRATNPLIVFTTVMFIPDLARRFGGPFFCLPGTRACGFESCWDIVQTNV